jgi:hypothetical protein
MKWPGAFRGARPYKVAAPDYVSKGDSALAVILGAIPPFTLLVFLGFRSASFFLFVFFI